MNVRIDRVAAIGVLTVCIAAAAPTLADPVDVHFNLLTSPDAVGLKAGPSGQSNDWLMLTDDDAAGTNDAGALSANFADPSGFIPADQSPWAMAPSLSGSLTLRFHLTSGADWSVTPVDQNYAGQATSAIAMNQFDIQPGSDAVTASGVNGLVDPGTWRADAAENWALDYAMDFYFATNVDGNPAPEDVDAAFDNTSQTGYLLPVGQLTSKAMAAVDLTTPAGFFTGDFEQYLLDEIAPRLPAEATYLLITQMDKTSPLYADQGLPITTGTRVGNTTLAYTTQVIPEPTGLALLTVSAALLLARYRRRPDASESSKP